MNLINFKFHGYLKDLFHPLYKISETNTWLAKALVGYCVVRALFSKGKAFANTVTEKTLKNPGFINLAAQSYIRSLGLYKSGILGQAVISKFQFWLLWYFCTEIAEKKVKQIFDGEIGHRRLKVYSFLRVVW